MEQRLCHTCFHCGIDFQAPAIFGQLTYCSAHCRVTDFPPVEPWEYKGVCGTLYYSKSRRQAYKDGDSIDPLVLYIYFKWMCYLCDEVIDKALAHPHPDCASIDHVLDLGLGGLHVWENVMPAHLRCNLAKNETTVRIK